MSEISTTWTQRDYVAFTAGSLSTISDCVTEIQDRLKRGTISATSSPTTTQVQNAIIWAKQKLCDKYGFTWRRKYVYANTAAGTWQYALPADFGGGGTILREITSDDDRLNYVDPTTFDTLYPDPAGTSNDTPEYYTIKDRELWLHAPADGTYTLELEYPRVGDDSTTTDISYLPQVARYSACDGATYRCFLLLQDWNAAGIWKAEWNMAIEDDKKGDATKKWASMNYMAKNWHYVKI